MTGVQTCALPIYSTITLDDVRIGDFVVVELSDDPEVARLVMVTLRRGAGS